MVRIEKKKVNSSCCSKWREPVMLQLSRFSALKIYLLAKKSSLEEML